MKVNLGATGVLAVAGLAAVAVLYAKRQAIANAVNPLNHDNVFATGVNAIGGAIVTDPAGAGKNADGSWSLGGWAYDVLHGGPVDLSGPVSPAPQLPPQDAGPTYDALGNVTGWN